MKVVNAGYKILTSFLVDPTLMIEKIGRVCYHSEDKIRPGSSDIFIQNLIERGHESVLEHSLITVQFTVDRGVSHELVRHRIASFTQESTRYCDYTDRDKYQDGITFVRPSHLDEDSWMERIWQAGCAECERGYKLMIDNGAKPEEARALLNNSVATTIVVSANYREWRHKQKGGKDDLFKAQFYLGKASYIMERDEEYSNYIQKGQIRSLLDIIDKAKRDYEDGDV